LDEALSEYQKAIEIKPDYAKGHFNLGSLFWQKKDLDQAITSFQEALEIDPKYGVAHYNLAILYYERKGFELAIQHVDQAVKLGVHVDPKLLEQLKPHR
jgi:tetratricopeptide (TPR) repeat protein